MITASFFIKTAIVLIISIVLSILDIKNLAVPAWPVITGCILMIAVLIVFDGTATFLYILSSAIFVLIYFIVRIVSKNKFGRGDILFGIFQGLCIHPYFIWVCLAVETLAAFIAYRNKPAQKLPFIPFMSAGLVAGFVTSLVVFAAVF